MKVRLKVRQEDLALTESLLDEVKMSYKDLTGLEVDLEINRRYFLKTEVHYGGVILCNLRGSIHIDNCLATRLKNVTPFMIPVINGLLFVSEPPVISVTTI
jgi:vacuolar-type H+-ATPase subunit E/Vma4